MGEQPLSYRETVERVTAFLEVAFHTILYLRQVYPPRLFQQRQKYGVPVWASRHPILNNYLGEVVESISEELGKGTLRKVTLGIKEANIQETLLERFVFDLEWLCNPEEIPKAGDDWAPRDGPGKSRVEGYLRAFLLKLNAADSYLLPNPPDVSFCILIDMKDDAPPPESTNAKKQGVSTEWIPAEERLAPGGSPDDTIGRSSITPLKSVSLGMINIQLVVEELDAKFGLEDARREDRLEEESRREIDKDRKGKGKAT